METLAKRLIAARTEKGLSQQALATLAGVAQSTIGGLEAGTRESARKITAIADALGVSAAWLADGRGPREPLAVPPAAPPERPVTRPQLQWVNEDEAEILSLYRQCADKATALVVLQALPKMVSVERGGLDE